MLTILAAIQTPFFPLLPLLPLTGSKLRLLILERSIRTEEKVVHSIGTDIEEELTRLISVLQHTSTALYITKDTSHKRQFLTSLLLKEGIIESLHVLNKNGYVVMRGGNKDTLVNYYTPCSHCPVVQVPASGKIFIETVHFSDNKIHTQIAIPIADHNNVPGTARGVLLTTIDSTKLFQNSQNVFNRKDVISYITDSSGRLLISIPGSKYPYGSSLSDLQPVKAGMSDKKWGSVEGYHGLMGYEVSGVAVSVNKLRWMVVSEINLHTINARVSSIIYYIKLILVTMGLLSVIAVFVLVIRLIKMIPERAMAERRERGITYFSRIGFPDIGMPDYPHYDYIVETISEETSAIGQITKDDEYALSFGYLVPYRNFIQPPERYDEVIFKEVWDGIAVSMIHGRGTDDLINKSYSKRKLLTYKNKWTQISSVVFDLRQVVQDAVNPLLFKAKEKGLELIIQCPPDIPAYVAGDPDSICRIIRYLVRNALNLTNSGCILIDIRCEARTSNIVKLKVRVKDSGIGIHDNQLEYIWGKVKQENALKADQFDESGSELAVCMSLVELMGGESGGYSGAGRGSVLWFIMSLPVVKERYEILHNRINLGKSRIKSSVARLK